jgi:hypothetical protein
MARVRRLIADDKQVLDRVGEGPGGTTGSAS